MGRFREPSFKLVNATNLLIAGTVFAVLLAFILFTIIVMISTHVRNRVMLERELGEISGVIFSERFFSSRDMLAEVTAFPSILEACRRRKPDFSMEIERLMQVVKSGSGASLVFILDREGTVLASTTYAGGRRLAGQNYAFRDYFKSAMQGQPVIDAALGVTTQEAGLYYSYPVRDPERGIVLGVVAAKINADYLEKIFAAHEETVCLVSADGFVLASDDPRLRYRLAYPMDAAEREQLIRDRHLGGAAAQPLEFSLKEDEVSRDKVSYTVASITTPIPGWQLVGLRPIRYPIGLIASVFVGGVVFALLLSGWLFIRSQRRASEGRLESFLGQYTSLMHASPDAVGIFDVKGRILSSNARVEAALGINGQTSGDVSLYDCVHEDDRVKVRVFVKDLFLQEGVRKLEIRLASGAPVEMSAAPILGDRRLKKAFHAVIRDVSWQINIQNTLRDSEERFRNVVESISMGVLLVSREGEILYMNRQLKVLFPHMHQTRPENASQCIFGLVEEACRDCPVHQVFLEGRLCEKIHTIRTGETNRHIRMVVSPVRRSTGNVETVIALVEDITERMQMMEVLSESRERFSTLVSNLPGVVYRCLNDDQWTMEFISDGIEALSGYSRRDFVHNRIRSYSDIIHPDDRERIRDMVVKSIEKRQAFVFEYRIVDQQGKIKWVYEKGQVVHDAQGNVVWIDGAIFDITERKLAEEERLGLLRQLAQAQKLESIGTLAAGVAHEINTPIQFINDNMQFVREGVRDILLALTACMEASGVSQGGDAIREKFDLDYLREELPKSLEQSREGVERVTAIIKAMKEFSHVGDREKKHEDLNKAVESTVVVSRSEWRDLADLRTSLDPEMPLVLCSVGDVKQVLLNLIINAAHAIRERYAGREGAGEITISTFREGAYAVISVRDNGSGIPEEIRDKVFDPFFTTRPVGKGTGQGLAMAYTTVVEQHAGELTFSTAEGRGTEFFVKLPVRPPQDSFQQDKTGKTVYNDRDMKG